MPHQYMQDVCIFVWFETLPSTAPTFTEYDITSKDTKTRYAFWKTETTTYVYNPIGASEFNLYAIRGIDYFLCVHKYACLHFLYYSIYMNNPIPMKKNIALRIYCPYLEQLRQ